MKTRKTDQLEELISNHLLTILVTILALALFAAIAVVITYKLNFTGGLTNETGTWGEFGDYFGGTLNPIFGFLSIIALLSALVIQSRELKFASQELKNSVTALNAQNSAIEHQNFEQTFFSWLKSYREISDNIEMSINKVKKFGADPFFVAIRGRNMLSHLWRLYFEDAKVENQGRYYSFNEIPTELIDLSVDYIFHQWEDLYYYHKNQLDSMFRVLYRLILWIDEEPEEKLSPENKWFYISIIRAQLSWIEMAFLYLNGLTSRGSKFKRLVEKYALFDNLPTDSDQAIRFISIALPDNNNYAKSAFDSNQAKLVIGI